MRRSFRESGIHQRATLLLFSIFAAMMLVSRFSRADDVDGQWKQSALREDFTVHQWLAGCGPAPPSQSSGGGETISIHQEGDELSFIGGSRTFNSRDCYDPSMQSLARESHSHDPAARTWRTRCTTPPNDPRRATMNTLVQETSDSHITLSETGRYEITLSDGKCIADVSRSRTFDKIKSDTPPVATVAPAVTPTPTVAPTPPPAQCGSPGEPARLEVRPSKKIMRQGESYTFHALVLDASGCATNTATKWEISDTTKGVTVEPNGKITVVADAPEGSLDITVTAAGKTAHVSVEVSSASHYDELLSQSGLNAAGESDVASTVSIASGSIGGAGHADDGSKRRKTIFIIIVSTVAALLGIVALIGWRRSKRAAALAREAEARHEERVREVEERKQKREQEHAAQLAAHEESKKKAAEHAQKQASMAPSIGTVCPSCRREFPRESTYCPHDGNRLVPMNAASSSPTPAGNVCPTCRRGYDPGVRICPADGDELVAHAMLTTAAPQLPKAKGKICPTCGSRFGPDGTFCGKDGTALVLLN